MSFDAGFGFATMLFVIIIVVTTALMGNAIYQFIRMSNKKERVIALIILAISIIIFLVAGFVGGRL